MCHHDRSRVSVFALSLALLLYLAPLVEAVDGVVLIDQNRALAGNVTPGDLPGFPVTISRPGSYRLSGNLDVADPNLSAIEITVSNVTLDLNGFTIQGPLDQCSGVAPVWCSKPPQTNGIAVIAPPFELRMNTRVLNGTVRAMAGDGLSLGSYAYVEKVMAAQNHGSGIVVQSGSIVTGSNAVLNGAHGFEVARSILIGNQSTSNGIFGVFSFSTSLVTNNVVKVNSNQDMAGFMLQFGNVCDGPGC